MSSEICRTLFLATVVLASACVMEEDGEDCVDGMCEQAEDSKSDDRTCDGPSESFVELPGVDDDGESEELSLSLAGVDGAVNSQKFKYRIEDQQWVGIVQPWITIKAETSKHSGNLGICVAFLRDHETDKTPSCYSDWYDGTHDSLGKFYDEISSVPTTEMVIDDAGTKIPQCCWSLADADIRAEDGGQIDTDSVISMARVSDFGKHDDGMVFFEVFYEGTDPCVSYELEYFGSRQ